MNNYDIIIIGAGISGIMLAYRLLQKNKSLDMILIDKRMLQSYPAFTEIMYGLPMTIRRRHP